MVDHNFTKLYCVSKLLKSEFLFLMEGVSWFLWDAHPCNDAQFRGVERWVLQMKHALYLDIILHSFIYACVNYVESEYTEQAKFEKNRIFGSRVVNFQSYRQFALWDLELATLLVFMLWRTLHWFCTQNFHE